MMPAPRKHLKDLYKLFAAVEDEREASLLLGDLLSPKELESLSERWQLIQALVTGMPQRKIAEKFNVSISKITRGSRMLQQGGSGFRYFLQKLQKN